MAAFSGKPLIRVLPGIATIRSALAGVHELGGPSWAWTLSGRLADEAGVRKTLY